MVELLPCPFCGSENIACEVTLSYAEIHCRNCKATITRGVMGEFECLADSEEYIKPEVVKAWNTRTQKEGEQVDR